MNQSHSPDEPLKVVMTIWAAVGPLLGVALGSYLSTRTQRRHWVMDNKKQEYRELLTIRDRIFVAGELREMKLVEKWIKATRDFDNTRDYDAFAKSFGEITRLITEAANRIIR